MAGAWICQHVWQKYLDSGDPNPLFTVYTMPVQQRQGDGYVNLPESTSLAEYMYDIATRAGETIVITNY